MTKILQECQNYPIGHSSARSCHCDPDVRKVPQAVIVTTGEGSAFVVESILRNILELGVKAKINAGTCVEMLDGRKNSWPGSKLLLELAAPSVLAFGTWLLEDTVLNVRAFDRVKCDPTNAHAGEIASTPAHFFRC